MVWDLKNQKGGVTMKRKNKMVVLSGVFCLVLTLGVLPFRVGSCGISAGKNGENRLQ